MTTEQVWASLVSLAQEVRLLRLAFEQHVKQENTMPRHRSEIVEPMRQCEGEQEDDRKAV